MRRYLATACAEVRARSGISQGRLARQLEMDKASVSRWEKAAAWPRDPDRVVAGYAAACGVRETEIWQAALDAWRGAGPGA